MARRYPSRPAGGDPGAARDRLKATIASHGIAVDYVQELDGALGTSSGGRIQVLTGLQPASEFMVLAHEFANLCSAVRYVRSGQGEIAPCSAMWSTMTT
jgi:hypothetical protein